MILNIESQSQELQSVKPPARDILKFDDEFTSCIQENYSQNIFILSIIIWI